MNIIIFTHNYPISVYERRNAGIFVHDFATELAKTCSVTVICPASFDKKVKFGSVTVYPPSRKTASVSSRMNAKHFPLRRDFSPDEAWGEDTPTVRAGEIHFFSWRGGKHLGKLKLWNPFDLFYGLNLFLRGSKILSQVAKETKFDFSLAMWAIPGGIFAYIAKIKFGIPYAIWVLGSDFYVYSKIPVLGFFISYVLRNAKYTFADGISLSDQVSKVTGKKCFFLPSSTKFEPPEIKKKINNPKSVVVLTFIGRMEAIKGPDILVHALIQEKDRVRKIKVNFLGDGSLLSILKKKAREKGIEKNVNFYGNIDDKKKIAQILANSDWLIIPSRSDSIPLVFSEGMKAGIPVITSDLPDLKYLVNKYKVGISFKTGSVLRLAKIIAQLPTLGNRRKIFSKNTANVAEIFDIKKSAQQFKEIAIWEKAYSEY